MTCREKLAMEFPERVDPKYTGGCNACPNIAGYLDEPDYCEDESIPREVRCTMCWDREIPEKKFTYEHSGEPIASVVKDIFEENGGLTVVMEPKSEHAKKLFEEPHILDSGNRTQFESGAVRDMREGKGRFDLVPLEVLCHAITGKSDLEETVIGCIRDFQITNDTEHLYEALFTFGMAAYKNDLYTMFLEVAKHFEEGAKKYGPDNWRKSIPVWCYIDSAVRHYLKWLRGDEDEPHDRAFVWNLMCCIWEVDYSPRAKDGFELKSGEFLEKHLHVPDVEEESND